MQKAEQQALHDFAVEEFRKRRLLGSIWLVGMLSLLCFTIFGAYKAVFG